MSSSWARHPASLPPGTLYLGLCGSRAAGKPEAEHAGTVRYTEEYLELWLAPGASPSLRFFICEMLLPPYFPAYSQAK